VIGPGLHRLFDELIEIVWKLNCDFGHGV
jgi:hypothetical protein